ncbi:MAG TPA: NAD(+) diphosphatase [Dermatophilaceae bacterium]|nr:NAD(+) diphosphatase [Dermatophilaceae bacterium]
MPRAETTLPGLALARGDLDRHAELRARPGLLEGLLADAATRVLALSGGRAPVELTPAGPVLRLRAPRPGDAEALVVLLGLDGDLAAGGAGTAYLAVIRPEEPGDAEETTAAGGPGTDLSTLRAVGADLPGRDAGLFTTALALANWHATHGHCPQCGAGTTPELAGWIRRCPRDGSEHYPRTDAAVIMAVVDGADRLLLARGVGFTARGISVLAGFVEPGESLAAAVEREVGEEVGVGVRDVTYVGDQPWPFPCSLMVGFTARATSTELRPQPGEIEAASWFTREQLAAALADGSVHVPPRVSIARRLIERWYGDELDVPDTVVRAR